MSGEDGGSRFIRLAMERREPASPGGRPAYSCSQTAAGVFAAAAGYDEEAALKAAAFFRGGMQAGEACGAVTGSLIALGLAGAEDREAADALLRQVRENHGGCLACRELLAQARERGLEKKPFCDAVIRECVAYTEQALRQRGLLKE